MVVPTSVGVGPAWIVSEHPGGVLLNGLVDRAGAGEHDLEAGVLESILNRMAHSARDHNIAVPDRIDQIVVATVVPRVLVIAAVGGADLAEFLVHLDAVLDLDDGESLGASEVRGDGVPVQGGKCDSHGLQDTVDSNWARKPIS